MNDVVQGPNNPADDWKLWLVINPARWLVPILLIVLAVALAIHFTLWGRFGFQGAVEPAPSSPVLNLIPNHNRPIAAITVADSDEVGLLEQQLGLEVVRVEGDTLYFIDDPKLRGPLQRLGYVPERADPYQVFQRVVRLMRKGDEGALRRSGVQMINREPDHWVVRGTLAQLLYLQGQGHRMAGVQDPEPRPREVRVPVADYATVRWIIATGTDVYSVEQTRQGLVVYAGAFDHQIDRMVEHGLNVVRISTLGGPR